VHICAIPDSEVIRSFFLKSIYLVLVLLSAEEDEHITRRFFTPFSESVPLLKCFFLNVLFAPLFSPEVPGAVVALN